MIHKLKTWPEYFAAILSGEKQFEIRKNFDRDFFVNDFLCLQEFNPNVGIKGEYTGEEILVEVNYLLPKQFTPEGFSIMGIRKVDQPALNPSEAVFGFASWLSVRDTVVIFSKNHESSEAGELAREFCEKQQLPDIRAFYPHNLKAMK